MPSAFSDFVRPAGRLLPLVTLGLLAACGDSSATGPARNRPADSLTALPRTLTATEQQALAQSNRFGFALLREVLAGAGRSDNVVLSPFSASVALAMTMNGTAGSTEAAMRSTLGWDATTPAATINGAYRDVSRLLGSLDASVTLTTANAIFYRQGFAVEPAFLQTARDFFGAAITAADFGAPATITAINDWASRATNGRVPRVIDELGADDVMVLLNALYFKGSWRNRFETRLTRPREFRQGDGRAVSIPFMHRTDGTVRAFYGPDFNILELPYGNGAYVMDLIVPRDGLALGDLAGRLAGQELATALLNLREREGVPIAVPRFRLTTAARLNAPLQTLGMREAFDCTRANFTRLTSTPRTCIGFVKQDAMIEVNEEGTEAAAVTSVGIIRTSLPQEFIVDRPFVFLIRERFSNTTYFVGAVQAIPAN